MTHSNSVGQSTSFGAWILENLAFFRMRLAGRGDQVAAMRAVLRRVDEYQALYERETGRRFADARVLEIGYGARPLRLMVLTSLGIRAQGVDLDQPVISGSIAEFGNILRRNGPKRLAKTLVRHLLFDRQERAALDRALGERGHRLRIERQAFIVGDAAAMSMDEGSVDFLYSEDVFEHIEPGGIETLAGRMAGWLSDGGLAVVVPSVFTGISGGHLPEWYPHTHSKAIERRSEPWEHLRKRRHVADCYLNELRIKDYRRIFSKYFDVIAEVNEDVGTGSSFLTDDIRAELTSYSEQELLVNRYAFVMRSLA